MRKRKKQLLGILGLIAVFVMTAIAYALPTPDAYAESSVSDSVKVKVTIPESESRLSIISPKNGDVLTSQTNGNNLVDVKIDHQQVYKVKLNTTCRNEAGDVTANVNSESDTSNNPSGELDVTADLGKLSGVNYCRLTATGLDKNGNDAIQDIVEFTFRSVSVDIDDKTDENGNPITNIVISDDVVKVMVQVFDKQGNPIFVNKDGTDEPIWIPVDKFFPIGDGNLSLSLSLPMKEYGAPAGWYDLVVVGYDSKDAVVSMNVTEFYYGDETADVPNAGSIFKDLNISHADYIITGLVVFGLVSGFAIFLIIRNKRHN